MISKESKIFYVVVFLIVLFSIAYTYYDTMILARFDIFISEDEIPTYSDILTKSIELIETYVQ